MNNITNQVAFLRTSREFPEDPHQMSVESNKAYVDVASAVNSRTIGLYPSNVAAITGNSYFFTNNRRQSLRRAYSFTTTADISLGFKIGNVLQVIQMYGIYSIVDGVTGNVSNYFGLIAANNIAIAGQISFYVEIDPTSQKSDLIKFASGAGAPTMKNGTIIIEWISQV